MSPENSEAPAASRGFVIPVSTQGLSMFPEPSDAFKFSLSAKACSSVFLTVFHVLACGNAVEVKVLKGGRSIHILLDLLAQRCSESNQLVPSHSIHMM